MAGIVAGILSDHLYVDSIAVSLLVNVWHFIPVKAVISNIYWLVGCRVLSILVSGWSVCPLRNQGRGGGDLDPEEHGHGIGRGGGGGEGWQVGVWAKSKFRNSLMGRRVICFRTGRGRCRARCVLDPDIGEIWFLWSVNMFLYLSERYGEMESSISNIFKSQKSCQPLSSSVSSLLWTNFAKDIFWNTLCLRWPGFLWWMSPWWWLCDDSGDNDGDSGDDVSRLTVVAT